MDPVTAIMPLAGLLLGGAGGWWLARRPPATLVEDATLPASKDRESGGEAPLVVTLDASGGFRAAGPGVAEQLDPETAGGKGKAIARLRLAASKHADALSDGGQPVEVEPFEYAGKRWSTRLVRRPDGDIDAHLTGLASLVAGAETDASAPAWPFLVDAPIGMARLDRRGRIHEHNRFLSRLLDDGEGVEAAIGRRLVDLVDDEQRAEIAGALERLRERDDDGNAEETLEVTLEGEEPTFVSLILRRDPRRGVDPKAFAIAYAIDVTERRLLETQFAQSQKMQAVGQLAGGVAHDFNNLLTAMTGFCDLLLQRHGPGDQSFADVMQIKQNTNRAANLVRQLLAFSRQQTLIPRVIDLTEMLADLSHLLRRLIGENVTFDLVHGRDLNPVKVDAGQLEQVLINLVVNARDAMPSGGTIALHTGNTTTVKPLRQGDEAMPPGDYVLIEVVDTGSGIPPDLLERIFEPFFTTKDIGQGTGLGLSTAFGIIKQFGGFVFVDSTPGVGTTFSIYLPAWDGPVDVGEVGGEAGIDQDLTGSGTVLLVEDEDPVRLFAARALRSKGYTVIEARSGEAALELLDREAPSLDLMVTDVVMPGVDGPTLVKAVRETRPDLPVVCISGYSEDALRQRIADTHGMAFLPKPFSLKQLAQAVKQTAARPETTS